MLDVRNPSAASQGANDRNIFIILISRCTLYSIVSGGVRLTLPTQPITPTVSAVGVLPWSFTAHSNSLRIAYGQISHGLAGWRSGGFGALRRRNCNRGTTWRTVSGGYASHQRHGVLSYWIPH